MALTQENYKVHKRIPEGSYAFLARNKRTLILQNDLFQLGFLIKILYSSSPTCVVSLIIFVERYKSRAPYMEGYCKNS
jgi:hypothetical protein